MSFLIIRSMPCNKGISTTCQLWLVSKDNNYFFYISILISPKINNIGSLTDEALLFIYLAFKFPMINVLYTAAIEYIFGAYSGLEVLRPPPPHPPPHLIKFGKNQISFSKKKKKVLERYPPDLFPDDLRPLMGVVGTDYIFTCATRNYTMNIASRNVPIWMYHVSDFSYPIDFSAVACADLI